MPCSWARTSGQRRVMKVLHCWLGFQAARENHWVDRECLTDDACADLACHKYLSQLAGYDAAWLVPGMILVSADPITTVVDPNPCTCKELWPPSIDQQVSTDTTSKEEPLGESGLTLPALDMGEEEELSSAINQLEAIRGTSKSSTRMPPTSPRLGSEDTLSPSIFHLEGISEGMRATSNDSTPVTPTSPPGPWRGSPSKSGAWRQLSKRSNKSVLVVDLTIDCTLAQDFGPDGAPSPISQQASTPYSTATVCKDYDSPRFSSSAAGATEPFFGWLRAVGVNTVVRANFEKEPGMASSSYDRRTVQSLGIKHLSLPFDDHGGAVPPRKLVARLLRNCDKREVFCLHCKGGFGRSVLLACCLAMDTFDVSGEAMLGWARVVRPGSITTTEQEVFLCALEGEKSLNNALAQNCCSLQ